MAAQYGKKTTYKISESAVSIAEQAQAEVLSSISRMKASIPLPKDHSEMLKPWLIAMQKGLMGGQSYSAKTISDYQYYVEPFLKRYEFLSIDTLKSALLSVPGDKRPTRVKTYKALLCFGKYLISEGYLPQDFLERAKKHRPADNTAPKRQTVDERQLLALYKTCRTRTNLLLILIIASTGLRAAETCALQWGDLDMEKGILTVRKGKGGKPRRVGLAPQILKLLAKIYGQRNPEQESAIFLNSEGHPFSPESLCKRISRLGAGVGIKVSPHVLRRAFVTINANKGRPLQMLQIACGHSNIKTTMTYCRTSEEDTIKAMQHW